MEIPDKKHYESEWLKLADGDMHDVEMVYVGEQQKEYNGHKRWVMLFNVLREWTKEGETRYDPPKKFETSCAAFIDYIEQAVQAKKATIVLNLIYNDKKKDWNLIRSRYREDSPAAA